MSNLIYGSISDLQGSTDATMTAFEVVQGGRSGLFYYDSTDTTSADDGAMTLVQTASSRRYKRRFEGFVRPEWFGGGKGGYVDETTEFTNAITFLKSKGGGVIKLGSNLYVANLQWHGSDNISVDGESPSVSCLASLYGGFCISVESGFPPAGVFIKNIRLYGGDTKAGDGIYINCGSSYYFENVVHSSLGIGVFVNGTIDNYWSRCTFRECFVGAVITNISEGHQVTTGINSTTTSRSITTTVAFFSSQPSEQTFTACRFFNSACHVYLDQTDTNYPQNNHVTFYGGDMQACMSSGVYIAKNTSLQQYPLVIDSVWLENTTGSSAPVVFNGHTLPVCDLYANGGLYEVRNTGLGHTYSVNGSIVKLSNCNIFYDKLYAENGGTYIGENLIGDGVFFPYQIHTGANDHGNRSLGFYTKPKVTPDRGFVNHLKYSESHGRDSAIQGGYGDGIVVTKINGGLMDGTCWNVFLPASTGLVCNGFPIIDNKIYVSVFNVRTDETPFELLAAATYVPNFTNLVFPVTNDWKSVLIIGRGNRSGIIPDPVDRYGDLLIYNVVENPHVQHTFQISGWQILEFDNVADAYAFMRSDNFTVVKVAPLIITNASLTVPTKTSLNSTYGVELAGSVITYPNLSGGTIEYQKSSDISTSDWIQTVWSTGTKSITS
ncbi:hypothetical protein Dfri01_43860 [Dyadobacter frigoris]|uniref:hypothetical protein n=1 Tax=Dyadobacter frigoris TaxID=2576211 RepID=UPI00249FD069|nr:hypothetical protein [Dyadobacter frigoris]GLU54925.1 hypothetical protein Dfri01_43860 [Dyadobacter frigoris]